MSTLIPKWQEFIDSIKCKDKPLNKNQVFHLEHLHQLINIKSKKLNTSD